MTDMPDWAHEVRARLATVRLSPEREAEIVDELALHLHDRWEELIAGGASPEEAAHVARAEFTSDRLAHYLAALRQAHPPAPIVPGRPRVHLLGDLTWDLRYAARTLAARRGFTLVAVVSLALGIGANTAIFSLWNAVLNASLPSVRDPGELVMLSDPNERGSWTGRWDGRTDGPRAWLTYEEFVQLRNEARSFSSMMASQSSLASWQVRVAAGAWEEARGRLVSGSYFEALGVTAAVGRVFTAADDAADTRVMVISHSYWQRRFGGRPDALGATVTVRNAVFTIVGIAPRGFIGETAGEQPDVWLPLRAQRSVLPDRDRLHDTAPEKTMWLHVFGRLKRGVTLAQAEAEANTIFRSGLQSFYGGHVPAERMTTYLDQRLVLSPGARGASATRIEFSQSLTALLAAVALLLLIACANLANLALARGASRRREMALRLALGASRARLVRQLVTESLVLALVGGAAALAVAQSLHAALVRMLAEADSRFHVGFSLDAVVLAFVVLATLLATLLFGMLPAWQITSFDEAGALNEQGRGSIGTFREMRSSRVLVSVQLALSLPLLVGAGLLARTVYNLQRADLGFTAEGVLLVRVDLRDPTYVAARRERVLRELTAEIQRIPGVRTVSHSKLGIFSGGESSTSIEVEGHTPTGDRDRASGVDVVGAAYFAAMGAPLRLGRDIHENDRGDTPKVCVINEAFAKQFFAGRSPIGRQVTAVGDGARTTYEVVGVAGDMHSITLRGEVTPRYFVAAAQAPASSSSPFLLVRTATGGGAVLEAVRRTIGRVDPALPILSTASIEEEMAPLTAQDRRTAQLTTVFGAVALALAAIGLYGVLSYGVVRRTAEIAVRIALGAQAARVVAMILRETIGLVVAGLALGAALTFAASRVIGSRLYGVTPDDPLTLVLATMLLVSVALAAAYVPARRASRLDPMAALRQ
jgi:predicted permease